MFQITALIGLLAIALIACGAPSETPTPGPKTIETEGLIPTATPEPTWTPYPTYTPYPTPVPTPDVEAIVKERVDSAVAAIVAQTPTPTLEPTPTPTPEPTPTRTPTPTPEPLVRPVAPPESNVLANILSISSISMQGRILRISGTIEGQGYDPSTIQVWHAYDPEPYSETCSTERPVAFVQPGNGSVVYTGQLTSYSWTFCTQYQKHRAQVDQVPWIYSQSWEYKLRDRRRINDPYIYDFSMSVNLDHERVESLEYPSGVASGWRVIIFSGKRILASQWIDG